MAEIIPLNRYRPTVFGKIPPQSITMYLDDNEVAFDGWENISLNKSIDNMAHSFGFNIPQKSETEAQDSPVQVGTKVSFYVNGQRVLTGRVEKLSFSLGPNNKSVQVSGRSLAADLVDCSAEGPNEYTNIRLDQLARGLVSPFGLEVFLSVAAEVIPKVGVRPGDSVFEVLDKHARAQGAFWISTRGGNIRLTRAGRLPAETALEENVNVKSANISVDQSKRFSRYKVLAQAPGTMNNPGKVSSKGVGLAFDRGVSTHRPLTIQAEGSLNIAQSKTRAQWEASSRIGKGIKIDITVQGWTQSTGTVWGMNQLTRVSLPSFGIDDIFLIVSVNQTQSNQGGTLTAMSLTREDAFSLKPVIPPGKNNVIR